MRYGEPLFAARGVNAFRRVFPQPRVNRKALKGNFARQSALQPHRPLELCCRVHCLNVWQLHGRSGVRV
jgi:hypothetical protein